MKNGRYYISCLCKDEIDERIPLSNYTMGIDFGLKDQFITEDRLYHQLIELHALKNWRNVYAESKENFLANMKQILSIRFIIKRVVKGVSSSLTSG